MNSRSNRVKSWLESISKELSTTYDIFASNMISKEDIGETEKHLILKDLNHLTTIIDDIIFKLDGRV
jgi:hypothetical protein